MHCLLIFVSKKRVIEYNEFIQKTARWIFCGGQGVASLKLSGVSFKYSDKVVAVSNLNFAACDKEFAVITGQMGSGKSTVLKLIAGLIKPLDGEILIDGQPAGDIKERDIAMVFEGNTLKSRATVYDNMAAGLKLRKTPPEIIDSRVKEAAAVLNITELLSRRVKTLTEAQMRRVSLCRAIVRRPKILLIDGLLSRLDEKSRLQIRTDIEKIYHTLDTTVIYTTNDPAEALSFAGAKVVAMNGGCIQQIGTPSEICDSPANTFVASFFGSSLMNMMPVGISLDGDCVILNLYAGKLRIPRNGMYVPNDSVLLVIEPKSIKCEAEFVGTHTDTAFFAEICYAEAVGNETVLHLRYGDNRMYMRTAARLDFIEGKMLRVAFDPCRIHLFDFNTDENLKTITD